MPTHRLLTWSRAGAAPATLDLELVDGIAISAAGPIVAIGADGAWYWIDGVPPSRWEVVEIGGVARHAALYAFGARRSYAEAGRRYGVTRSAVEQAARALTAEPRPRATARPPRRAGGGRRVAVRVPGWRGTIWLTPERQTAWTEAAAGKGGIGEWLRGLLERQPVRSATMTAHLRRIGDAAAGISSDDA